MKIAWIRIKGFQQFEDTFLDFRHPDTGKALSKVCLIGRNGTGKSTILNLCNIAAQAKPLSGIASLPKDIFIAFKIESEAGSYIICGTNFFEFFNADIENISTEWYNDLYEFYSKGGRMNGPIPFRKKITETAIKYNKLSFNPGKLDRGVTLFIPSETSNNPLMNLSGMPPSSLNDALKINLESINRSRQEISNQTISDYWKLLIALIKKRESDREKYEKEEENLNKTKRVLIEEFEQNNPDILKVIADLWNEILSKGGLRFDYENAKRPIQLTENLEAYIVNNKNIPIAYNRLSTGIRNFIFRFGHIKTIFFNRVIKGGLLLVDEPENSLFPDFLLDIIKKYEAVVTDKNGERNVQMFFATHSPIIAAQFEPYERIILDWTENGTLDVKHGVSPIGDDPNDILYQDFGMTEIVSKEGQEIWKAYLDLKKRLLRERNPIEKEKIVTEISEIGRKYNFD